MSDKPLSRQKAQLDKAEREQLEAVVESVRTRIENHIRFRLTQRGLDEEPADRRSLDGERARLVDAIELEGVDDNTWAEAFEQYVAGVGYTIVNRLAALRCLEVREFIDDEVTVFKDNGLTPAAETLVREEFLLEAEAILAAYHRACDDLAAEIAVLFDRESAYSLLDPDSDTFEHLCLLLDEVPDAVWRADDVLGWVYEYYNTNLLDDLRRKGNREGLEPADVPPANQFYTPHWVVRMLTDNSLGKLYLEDQGELQAALDRQDALSADERKNRPLSPDESPDIADFCTYLVPSEEAGEPPEFDGPEDLRVIDPACGSGHFLLYAFDVLERIWRAETDLDSAEIPRAILRHNLYGVDLDMRACQLAAFNLYLKGRTRSHAEGADGFEMPDLGIVCADATVADMDGVEAVFDEVAGGKSAIEDALGRILDAFEEVHGLGSLLDVRGTLGSVFENDAAGEGVQITLDDDPREDHTLGQILGSLREAVDDHQSESFLAQDLRSFVRLLDVLAQDYDVALMNPPYGSRNRMPDTVTRYIEHSQGFEYTPEYYINFFEVCERLAKKSGRVGMLVPRSFMFKRRFSQFRADFLGERGSFDFLAEYGLGVLDNATVRTVGTVVRTAEQGGDTGDFIRLSDVGTREKEAVFLESVLGSSDDPVEREYHVALSEFQTVPWTSISYWTPSELRSLHTSERKLDPSVAGIDGTAIGTAAKGMDTGNNSRFIRTHWESEGDDGYIPYAKGGSDAWIKPETRLTLNWHDEGRELARFPGSNLKNSQQYRKRGLTWTYAKETGRRFGYVPAGGAFDGKGSMFFPETVDPWTLMAVLNSSLYHNLVLSVTPERDWQVGDVGRIPWVERLEQDRLAELARQQYSLALASAVTEPTSPHYVGPQLLPEDRGFFYDHPYTELDLESGTDHVDTARSDGIVEASRRSRQRELRRRRELEAISNRIDEEIYGLLNIGPAVRSRLNREIFLRTGEDPEDRRVPDPESVPERPERTGERVRDLVHHFAMVAVREEPDGIIPLEATDERTDMLARVVACFEDTYGEYAEDRLVEVDRLLGSESATEEAYPNLRSFIADELFAYHVDRMENTPIIWRLTTTRLVPDATGEGFACFLDYHQLDAGLFDRLVNRYLEPRKADLRERRAAANRRRGDDALSGSEQAAATETHKRCVSGLDQIAAFEDVIQELSGVDERESDATDRRRVAELAPKVAAFREETAERIDTLARLREHTSEDWFQDTFSPSFWATVQERRDEWLDALAELKYACEACARPADEPVEAHLADLFDYFNNRLVGTDHFASSGVLFLTYYFEREGGDLLNSDGEPFEALTADERLLASLATGVDDRAVLDERYLERVADENGVDDIDSLSPIAEFKALAREVGDRCQTIRKRMPRDWADRALSEITTAGYRPNHKHGVAINITPLADAHIVPELVEDSVL